MAVEEKVFVRKATGLVREIGFITAIIIVIANTVGLGWQKRVFQYTGRAPLPENQYLGGIPPMTMAFIVGGIAILLSVLAVSMLTAAMPRSGGGYVSISRIIGPSWGFLAAWFEFLSIAWSFGIIAVAVFEGVYLIIGPTVFPGITTPSGIGTEWFLFATGLVLVIIFTAIGLFGVKLTGLLLQAMFWVPAVLTFYVFGLLSQANATSLTTGMSNLLGATPGQYLARATDSSLASSLGKIALQDKAASVGGYWGAVATALFGAYFAYVGYAASTFVAGEIKEANKNIPKAVIYATLLIIVLYVSISVGAAGALKGVAAVCVNGSTVTQGKCTGTGLEYSLLTAWSYLSHAKDSVGLGTVGQGVGLWTTSVASLTASGIGLGSANILLVVFGVFWIANDIPPFILTASRILFAMSFDRVLPAPLANVNDRFHSPMNAVLATGIVAILGCISESALFDPGGPLNPGKDTFLSVTLGSGGGVQLTDFLDALFFTIFTFSLVLLPLRASKRQIFDTAPYKPGGKWGMVLLGLGGFVANLTVIYEFLIAPGGYNINALSTSTNLLVDISGELFVVTLGIVGLIMYYAYRMRGRGVNYSTIFAQIPPE